MFSVIVRPDARTRVFVNLILQEKMYTKEETMCPNDGYVYFHNSELICGQLGKVTLGEKLTSFTLIEMILIIFT